MNEINYFAKNIAYFLNSKKITTQKLLDLTEHKSEGLISMWKTGERQPLVKDVVLIANYFNITVDDLINREIQFNNLNFTQINEKYKKLSANGKEMVNNLIDTIYSQENKDSDE